MIHDAVRPFIDDEVLTGAINRTKYHSAVIVANPLMVDVVEIGDDKCVKRTISRKCLYTDEAPQIFNINLLTKFAKKYSAEELAGITDLSTLFVDNGEKVYIMEGNVDNIKITTDKDIAVAQRLVLGDPE
jgi:2-C-methyl-D-erythritol 4-phosphate cytidylyltransferase